MLFESIKEFWKDQLVTIPDYLVKVAQYPDEIIAFLSELGIPKDTRLWEHESFSSLKLYLTPEHPYLIQRENQKYLVLGYIQTLHIREYVCMESGSSKTLLISAYDGTITFINSDILKFVLCLKVYLENLKELTHYGIQLSDDMENMDKLERLRLREKLRGDIKEISNRIKDAMVTIDSTAFSSPNNYWSLRYIDWTFMW